MERMLIATAVRVEKRVVLDKVKTGSVLELITQWDGSQAVSNDVLAV